jgi:hypothetical protein
VLKDQSPLRTRLGHVIVRQLEGRPRTKSDNSNPIEQQAPITTRQSPLDRNPPHLQIRRRIKRKHSLSILIRQNSAQRPLSQLAEPLILGALVQHIRAEIPVGLGLVDGVPLVLLLEVGAAHVVPVAGRDEVEFRRPVWAQSAFV